MKIGFMPASSQNILSEIEFAKKHFDFIEITSNEDLSIYNKDYVSNVKKALGNFKIIGHVHWRINILDEKGIEKAKKSILMLKKLGAKNIVIHPYNGEEKDFEKLKRMNLSSLLKIKKECQKHKLTLLVENKDKPPFNRAEVFRKVLKNFNFTLDIGHAYRTSSKEIEEFLKLKNRIKHIHLHDTINNVDHLAFQDKKTLKNLINKIKELTPKSTITLEIFRKIKDNQMQELDNTERKETLIKQLNIIKK